jgi:hypothetical protein
MGWFAGSGAPAVAATWVAAAVTLTVLAYLAGERRLFRMAQHLLAGLATGYLVVLAVREVLLPRLIEPLATQPAANLLLWPAAVLVVVMAAARWLPRRVVAIPVAVLVAGTAAFALGGAVAGTVLPQMAGTLVTGDGGVLDLSIGVGALVMTALVVLAFLHGVPRGRLLGGANGVGRWLLVAGIGGFVGFLVVSRLALLVDRLTFLLSDWLGIA